MEDHADWDNALAACPAAALPCLGSDDMTIRPWDGISLWHVKTGNELTRLELDFAVTCLTVLGNKWLAAGDAGPYYCGSRVKGGEHNEDDTPAAKVSDEYAGGPGCLDARAGSVMLKVPRGGKLGLQPA